MNAVTESAESVQAVGEVAGDRPFLNVEGSKVYAEMTADGVLVVRACPAGDTPVALLVDESLVSGHSAGWKSHGKHRKSPESAPSLDRSQETR